MAARGSSVLGLLMFLYFLGFFTNLEAFNTTEIGSVVLPVHAVSNVTFYPSAINGLVWRETTEVNFQVYTDSLSVQMNSGKLYVESEDEAIASILGDSEITFNYNTHINDEAFNTSFFSVHGGFIGRTHLKYYLKSSTLAGHAGVQPTYTHVGSGNNTGPPYGQGWEEMPETIKVSVVRPDRAVDKMFIGLVALLVICANIGMGCKVDLDVVREVLRKPLAPIIGFCCQFIIMPLTAYGVVKMLGLSGGIALGYFATGCAPGGGSSNIYSFLLNGDVSLSVTMTLISTLSAFAMIPLWMYTLGKTFTDEYGIKIPFLNIMITLLCIVIPVGIGLIIQKKRPKVAEFVVKRLLRGFFIVIILVMFTFGVWANVYIFQLISPKLLLAGCILPYTGFLLSGLVAFLCRQPVNRIITIAIEAGIQNTGIPIILMKFSAPQPEADLSVVAPVVVAMFMPLPLWIAITVLEIRKRCCKKKAAEQANSEETSEQKDTTDEQGLMTHKENGFHCQDEATFNAKDREMKVLNGNSDPVLDDVMNNC